MLIVEDPAEVPVLPAICGRDDEVEVGLAETGPTVPVLGAGLFEVSGIAEEPGVEIVSAALAIVQAAQELLAGTAIAELFGTMPADAGRIGARAGFNGLTKTLPEVLAAEVVLADATFFCGTFAVEFVGAGTAPLAQAGCASGAAIFCATICANSDEPLAGFPVIGAAAAVCGTFAAGRFAGIIAMLAAGITLHSNSGAIYAQG